MATVRGPQGRGLINLQDETTATSILAEVIFEASNKIGEASQKNTPEDLKICEDQLERLDACFKVWVGRTDKDPSHKLSKIRAGQDIQKAALEQVTAMRKRLASPANSSSPAVPATEPSTTPPDTEQLKKQKTEELLTLIIDIQRNMKVGVRPGTLLKDAQDSRADRALTLCNELAALSGITLLPPLTKEISTCEDIFTVADKHFFSPEQKSRITEETAYVAIPPLSAGLPKGVSHTSPNVSSDDVPPAIPPRPEGYVPPTSKSTSHTNVPPVSTHTVRAESPAPKEPPKQAAKTLQQAAKIATHSSPPEKKSFWSDPIGTLRSLIGLKTPSAAAEQPSAQQGSAKDAGKAPVNTTTSVSVELTEQQKVFISKVSDGTVQNSDVQRIFDEFNNKGNAKAAVFAEVVWNQIGKNKEKFTKLTQLFVEIEAQQRPNSAFRTPEHTIAKMFLIQLAKEEGFGQRSRDSFVQADVIGMINNALNPLPEDLVNILANTNLSPKAAATVLIFNVLNPMLLEATKDIKDPGQLMAAQKRLQVLALDANGQPRESKEYPASAQALSVILESISKRVEEKRLAVVTPAVSTAAPNHAKDSEPVVVSPPTASVIEPQKSRDEIASEKLEPIVAKFGQTLEKTLANFTALGAIIDMAAPAVFELHERQIVALTSELNQSIADYSKVLQDVYGVNSVPERLKTNLELLRLQKEKCALGFEKIKEAYLARQEKLKSQPVALPTPTETEIQLAKIENARKFFKQLEVIFKDAFIDLPFNLFIKSLDIQQEKLTRQALAPEVIETITRAPTSLIKEPLSALKEELTEIEEEYTKKSRKAQKLLEEKGEKRETFDLQADQNFQTLKRIIAENEKVVEGLTSGTATITENKDKISELLQFGHVHLKLLNAQLNLQYLKRDEQRNGMFHKNPLLLWKIQSQIELFNKYIDQKVAITPSELQGLNADVDNLMGEWYQQLNDTEKSRQLYKEQTKFKLSVQDVLKTLNALSNRSSLLEQHAEGTGFSKYEIRQLQITSAQLGKASALLDGKTINELEGRDALFVKALLEDSEKNIRSVEINRARIFIESGKNPYRILLCNSDSKPDEIKQNYEAIKTLGKNSPEVENAFTVLTASELKENLPILNEELAKKYAQISVAVDTVLQGVDKLIPELQYVLNVNKNSIDERMKSIADFMQRYDAFKSEIANPPTSDNDKQERSKRAAKISREFASLIMKNISSLHQATQQQVINVFGLKDLEDNQQFQLLKLKLELAISDLPNLFDGKQISPSATEAIAKLLRYGYAYVELAKIEAVSDWYPEIASDPEISRLKEILNQIIENNEEGAENIVTELSNRMSVLNKEINERESEAKVEEPLVTVQSDALETEAGSGVNLLDNLMNELNAGKEKKEKDAVEELDELLTPEFKDALAKRQETTAAESEESRKQQEETWAFMKSLIALVREIDPYTLFLCERGQVDNLEQMYTQLFPRVEDRGNPIEITRFQLAYQALSSPGWKIKIDWLLEIKDFVKDNDPYKILDLDPQSTETTDVEMKRVLLANEYSDEIPRDKLIALTALSTEYRKYTDGLMHERRLEEQRAKAEKAQATAKTPAGATPKVAAPAVSPMATLQQQLGISPAELAKQKEEIARQIEEAKREKEQAERERDKAVVDKFLEDNDGKTPYEVIAMGCNSQMSNEEITKCYTAAIEFLPDEKIDAAYQILINPSQKGYLDNKLILSELSKAIKPARVVAEEPVLPGAEPKARQPRPQPPISEEEAAKAKFAQEAADQTQTAKSKAEAERKAEWAKLSIEQKEAKLRDAKHALSILERYVSDKEQQGIEVAERDYHRLFELEVTVEDMAADINPDKDQVAKKPADPLQQLLGRTSSATDRYKRFLENAATIEDLYNATKLQLETSAYGEIKQEMLIIITSNPALRADVDNLTALLVSEILTEIKNNPNDRNNIITAKFKKAIDDGVFKAKPAVLNQFADILRAKLDDKLYLLVNLTGVLEKQHLQYTHELTDLTEKDAKAKEQVREVRQKNLKVLQDNRPTQLEEIKDDLKADLAKIEQDFSAKIAKIEAERQQKLSAGGGDVQKINKEAEDAIAKANKEHIEEQVKAKKRAASKENELDRAIKAAETGDFVRTVGEQELQSSVGFISTLYDVKNSPNLASAHEKITGDREQFSIERLQARLIPEQRKLYRYKWLAKKDESWQEFLDDQQKRVDDLKNAIDAAGIRQTGSKTAVENTKQMIESKLASLSEVSLKADPALYAQTILDITYAMSKLRNAMDLPEFNAYQADIKPRLVKKSDEAKTYLETRKKGRKAKDVIRNLPTEVSKAIDLALGKKTERQKARELLVKANKDIGELRHITDEEAKARALKSAEESGKAVDVTMIEKQRKVIEELKNKIDVIKKDEDPKAYASNLASMARRLLDECKKLDRSNEPEAKNIYQNLVDLVKVQAEEAAKRSKLEKFGAVVAHPHREYEKHQAIEKQLEAQGVTDKQFIRDRMSEAKNILDEIRKINPAIAPKIEPGRNNGPAAAA